MFVSSDIIMSKTSRHNKVQNYESTFKSSNTDPRAVCKHCVHLNKKLPLESQLPTNHWLRDNRDPCKRFTCPVVLKSRCECCFNKGHVAFWCTEKEKPFPVIREYTRTAGFDAETARMKPPQRVSAATSNIFACLDTEGEETKKRRKLNNSKSHVQESASTGSSGSTQAQEPVKTTYAAYAKQAMSYEPPRAKNRSPSPSPEEIAEFRANPPRLVRGCWADVVDDDDSV